MVVVSGLALGIDTKGHEGCVASGGKGVAVLAHGLHIVIPASNQLLASRLLESGGCLVSEYPYGEPPRKNYFVERAELQSGQALLPFRPPPPLEYSTSSGSPSHVLLALYSNKGKAGVSPIIGTEGRTTAERLG